MFHSKLKNMKVLRDPEDDLVTVGGDIAVFSTNEGLKQMLEERWRNYATVEELIFKDNNNTVIVVMHSEFIIGKSRIPYTIEELAVYQ